MTKVSHNNGVYCGPCWKCKTTYWLPQPLYDAAQRSEKISFFCPYGHEAVFGNRESEADILRRERDRLQQQVAEREDRIANLQRTLEGEIKEAAALRKAAVKTKKRTASGVCPCCNRTFRQMALHMKTQHPQFVASEVH